jgi:ubiquinone/menaquinone biosynthesis C-methylase UbiE
MRFLESAPRRYDAGMRLLTLGAVSQVHEALACAAASKPGRRVLEIGCGTGAATERLIARGAVVSALDQSPEMLELAKTRLAGRGPGSVTWIERTASELDAFEEGSFDAVVASFTLSEMSRDERRVVLRQAARCLRPGGTLAAADEVIPRTPGKRVLQAALRGPQAALGWILTGSVSRPVPDLAAEIREAGLDVSGERRWLLESLAMVTAEKPR